MESISTRRTNAHRVGWQLGSILVCFSLALTASAQRTYQLKPRHKTVVKAQNKTGLITLERSVCFGTCPSYIVTLASDGKVIWEGRDFVKTMGKATAQIRPEGFDKLVKEFEKIKFATLDDKYETGTRGCPESATDNPSAQVSIRTNGKTKSVLHYYGCRDSEVLRKLTALERKIDEVAGTERWIK